MFLLFDFDGTLVDSMPVWGGAHINMLEEYGIPCPDGFVKTITPLGNKRASEYTISLGVPLTLEQYLSKHHVILDYEYGQRILLKNNVKEVLTALKSKGHSLNVLTASPHKYLDPCLKRCKVYSLFDNVWSIDDFGLTKDNVKIYEKAAARLGASLSECVFFDDNETAIKTAKKAGMFTVGVYDPTSKDAESEIRANCDKYVYDFIELIK